MEVHLSQSIGILKSLPIAPAECITSSSSAYILRLEYMCHCSLTSLWVTMSPQVLPGDKYGLVYWRKNEGKLINFSIWVSWSFPQHLKWRISYIGLPSWLMVKNLPAMWENWVWSLGWEDPLEEAMATCSSILAWRIPWTEEPGGLLSH